MAEFTLHDKTTAPADSRPLLEASEKGYGMIPNLHAVMAESPQVLKAYQDLHGLFQETSLGTVEQNVVWLTINVEHHCHYCVPAHTVIAQGAGVPEDVIEALRNGQPLADERLEALRRFTLKLVRERGRVSDEDIAAFKAAGYTDRHVLEVILGIAQKVMSNYINAIAETPLDAPFEKHAWQPAA